MLDSKIFKAYDIRGTYPQEINEDIAYNLGRAFVTMVKHEYSIEIPSIVVGYDMRTSSPSLKDAVIHGITDEGGNAIDVGMVTTPTFYFSTAFYKYDGGIQVSASHNPKEFNGFKMVERRSEPVGGDSKVYKDIQNLVQKGQFPITTKKGDILIKNKVVEDAVKEQTLGLDRKSIKPFKVVLETGNGSSALDLDAIFKDLPCELVKVNYEIDGNFPVHTPDPLKEDNLKWAKDAVIESKADLGIVPDGDGDRIFFIDEKGGTVPQPILRGLMAQIELKGNPGAVICYDIRPGKITKEMIEGAGGVPQVTRVGHSFIKQKMIETGAIFGGESSGHYYYKFPYGIFESPIVLIDKFLIYLSNAGKPVSQLLAPYNKYFHSGEINSEVSDKQAKMDEIVRVYKDAKIDHLDGVTIEYPDYWFNVRPSNTENLLRLNLEATSRELMENKTKEVLELIKT